MQAGLAFGYECREDQGAMIRLKHEVTRQAIFDNDHIRDYILRHHDTWCKFIIDDLRLHVEPDRIIFVSGWTKTASDWTATAFMSTTSGFHASIESGVGGMGGMSVEYSKRHSSTSLKISRRGSRNKDETDEERGRFDQCIFLRRYMVKKKFRLLSKIEAAAEPDSYERHSDGEREMCCVSQITTDGPSGDEVRLNRI